MTAPRRLATIVALDVAGYSARTEADETVEAPHGILTPGLISTHAHIGGSPLDRSFIEDRGNPQFFYSGLFELLPVRGAAQDEEATRACVDFSMVELLVLGGGSPAAFNAWGVYSLRTAGCLCSRLPAPVEWRRWWGLSQSGLPATLVADLPLRVAVVLHNLQLPAVLAKSVLAAAMQDFVDSINPSDGNDWLALAR